MNETFLGRPTEEFHDLMNLLLEHDMLDGTVIHGVERLLMREFFLGKCGAKEDLGAYYGLMMKRIREEAAVNG